MRWDGFTVEQIIRMLREAEVHLSQGKSVKLVSRELGIAEQTHYRWSKVYGGMKVSRVSRLKELEQENARLKTAVYFPVSERIFSFFTGSK
jgi:putative transposase